MRETRTRDGSSAGSHDVCSRLAGGAPVGGGGGGGGGGLEIAMMGEKKLLSLLS